MNLRDLTCLVLTVAFLISLAGCKKHEPARGQEPPAYTEPTYTDIESNAAPAAIQFTDVTRDAGIDFVHETGAFGKKWMPETMGSGGGFLDYNDDGLPDIFLVNSAPWPGRETSGEKATQRLYRNQGNGRFTDVTVASGLALTLYGMGCAFADYDGDGDTDIYLTAVGDNKLLRNDGGKFREVTSQAGVIGNSDNRNDPPAWSTSAVWVDVDRDGRLDLFVCNYVKWSPETDLYTTLDGSTKSYATPEQYAGETCRLYRNLDGQRFDDITKAAGMFNPDGKSLGVAVSDFNRDGWPDLVVANDTQPNFLYFNNGDGTFTDVALRAGIGYDEFGRARAGMGIDVADLNNNGWLSIAIGNFAREPLSLYTQINEALFQDLAGSARLTTASLLRLTFGVLFVDLDLDGFQDLVAANGHIEPEVNRVQQAITFAQSPQFFRNNQGGQFVDISDRVGEPVKAPLVARGIAAADVDNDGDLDLLITVNGGTPKLLRNELRMDDANWVKLRLVGKGSNRNAIGSRVTAWAGDLRQERIVRTGSSYLSQSDFAEIVFGLADRSQVDSLKITWSTTQDVTRVGSLQARQTYLIEEGAPFGRDSSLVN